MQAAPETAWRDMLKRFAVPTLGRPVQRRRQNANCLSFRGREDMCQHSLVDNIYFAICSSPGFPRLLVHSALYTGVWVEMGDTAAVDGAGRSGSDPVRGKPRHLRHSARPPSIRPESAAAIVVLSSSAGCTPPWCAVFLCTSTRSMNSCWGRSFAQGLTGSVTFKTWRSGERERKLGFFNGITLDYSFKLMNIHGIIAF